MNVMSDNKNESEVGRVPAGCVIGDLRSKLERYHSHRSGMRK